MVRFKFLGYLLSSLIRRKRIRISVVSASQALNPEMTISVAYRFEGLRFDDRAAIYKYRWAIYLPAQGLMVKSNPTFKNDAIFFNDLTWKNNRTLKNFSISNFSKIKFHVINGNVYFVDTKKNGNYYHNMIDVLSRFCFFLDNTDISDIIFAVYADAPSFVIEIMRSLLVKRGLQSCLHLIPSDVPFRVDGFLYAVNGVNKDSFDASDAYIDFMSHRIFSRRALFLNPSSRNIFKGRFFPRCSMLGEEIQVINGLASLISEDGLKSLVSNLLQFVDSPDQKQVDKKCIVSLRPSYGKRPQVNDLRYLISMFPSIVLVDFSDMDIQSQIKLASSCSLMIGEHGANLVNSIFMEAGTTLIEIFPDQPLDEIGLHYQILSELNDIKYRRFFDLIELNVFLEGYFS